MSKTLQALNQLNDRLAGADAIGQALHLAGGEATPAWVDVYQRQVEAIRDAAEVLELLIREAEHV